jgi:hypothetical protein
VTDGDGLTTTILFNLVAGHFPDDILFFEPGIILNVSYNDNSLDGNIVYVTSFLGGGNVPDDTVEVKSGILANGSASIKMDNYNSGYADGSYEILVHIDVNRDVVLTKESGKDYVTLGEVTINGGSAGADINQPWGIYFPIIMLNTQDPDPGNTDDKTMYLALV